MHGLNMFCKAKQSFQKLVDYLDLVPEQKMGLTDAKFATSAKFRAFVELGLRTFALSGNKPLGKHAMRSPQDWEQVSQISHVLVSCVSHVLVSCVYLRFTNGKSARHGCMSRCKFSLRGHCPDGHASNGQIIF